MKELTTRQREVLGYVIKQWAYGGAGPRVKDVQRHFEFSSYTGALDHVTALARKGNVELVGGIIYPIGLRKAIQESMAAVINVTHETTVP